MHGVTLENSTTNVQISVANRREEILEYDLALRKFITQVNTGGTVRHPIPSREPVVDTTPLQNGTSTTAIYTHDKTPVRVRTGDIVRYTIRIFNEGDVPGRAMEITDWLPSGTKLTPDSAINAHYGWIAGLRCETTGRKAVTTNFLATQPAIPAFNMVTGDIQYVDVQIETTVIATSSSGPFTNLMNVAEITEDDSADFGLTDRDSDPGNVDLPTYNPGGGLPAQPPTGPGNSEWQEDDDDYEDLELVGDSFDLTLRKTDEAGLPITSDSATFVISRVPGAPGSDDLHDTNNQGIIRIEDIDITSAGEIFIFEIREIRAPEGFEIIIEPFFVRITTGLVGDNFVITAAELGNMVAGAFVPASNPYNIPPAITLTWNSTGIQINVANRRITPDAPEFDLALRKFITQINGVDVPNSRVPSLDLSPLRDGTGTTAIYTHPKYPLLVRQGDVVTFNIRVYNEGDLDGFVSEITDNMPEGLAFIMEHNTNLDNRWQVPINASDNLMSLIGEDPAGSLFRNENAVRNLNIDDFYGITSLEDVQLIRGQAAFTTRFLERNEHDPESNLIRAFDPELRREDVGVGENWQQTDEEDYEDGLFYREVQIVAIVIAPNTYPGVLRNIAEITEDQDEDGIANTDPDRCPTTQDRDSRPGNVDLDDYNTPGTPPQTGENNSTWQEDDDDYEQLRLVYFDLALRKFITEIYSNGVTREPVPSREPVVTMPPNFGTGEGETSTLEYTHDKTPVPVRNGNIVTYTIRVFNEGTMAGFAAEIRDNLPIGIQFLPDHEVNEHYEWNMYFRDEDGNPVRTNYLSEATEIRTRYLSYERNGVAGRNNLLQPFDSSQPIRQPNTPGATEGPWNPDFRDVRVAFKVVEEELPENANRIITNVAEITENQDEDGNHVNDIDSTPDNDIYDEDDQGEDHIFVEYFDLALYKWVSRVIIYDGKTTVERPHQKPSDDPWSDYLVKIPVDRDIIRNGTIDIVYTIRVRNVGMIPGWATEIIDIPAPGLRFIPDNPINMRYGWQQAGDNTLVTRVLAAEQYIIQPGEYRDIQISMRWINDGENLGLRRNLASITESYNHYGAPDIDPDNEEDDAWIILERETFGVDQLVPVIVSTAVISILGAGMFLIKRYVIV